MANYMRLCASDVTNVVVRVDAAKKEATMSLGGCVPSGIAVVPRIGMGKGWRVRTWWSMVGLLPVFVCNQMGRPQYCFGEQSQTDATLAIRHFANS